MLSNNNAAGNNSRPQRYKKVAKFEHCPLKNWAVRTIEQGKKSAISLYNTMRTVCSGTEKTESRAVLRIIRKHSRIKKV